MISPGFFVKSTCQELQLLLFCFCGRRRAAGQRWCCTANTQTASGLWGSHSRHPAPCWGEAALQEAFLWLPRELQHKMKWFGAFILNPPQSHWACVCPGALVLLFVWVFKIPNKESWACFYITQPTLIYLWLMPTIFCYQTLDCL